MVAHTCNPSNKNAKAGRPTQIEGQHGLHTDLVSKEQTNGKGWSGPHRRQSTHNSGQ